MPDDETTMCEACGEEIPLDEAETCGECGLDPLCSRCVGDLDHDCDG